MFLALPGAGLTAVAWEAGKFFAIVNTLAAESRVNIVSNPHVMTSENKKAVINVSTSVPVVTSQQVPVATVIERAAAVNAGRLFSLS